MEFLDWFGIEDFFGRGRKKQQQRVKVGRTPEGTAFEVAFVVLAVLVWVAIVLMLNRAPDVVPTHFGPSGQPDAYGSKLQLLFPCIVMTVMGACCLAGAYFPHTVNLPGVQTVNARQAALAVRMMRVVALMMLVLTLAIAYSALRTTILPILLGVVLTVGACLVFTVLIYRAK